MYTHTHYILYQLTIYMSYCNSHVICRALLGPRQDGDPGDPSVLNSYY